MLYEVITRADRGQNAGRIKAAVGFGFDPFQHHTLPFAQEMPRHDIGMMFQHAQHDFIARLKASYNFV